MLTAAVLGESRFVLVNKKMWVAGDRKSNHISIFYILDPNYGSFWQSTILYWHPYIGKQSINRNQPSGLL